MYKKLSSKEKIRLISEHRQERDKRKCDRIKAVLAYNDGYSYSEISRILLLHDETIRRHIKDYFTNNKKVSPENGGKESLLGVVETEQLIIHLKEKTYLYVKNICIYVKATFDVKYSISGMSKWLKANNFCYKKPHVVPAKANAKEQEAFVEFYKELKKTAGKEFAKGLGITLHYLPPYSPNLNPIERLWKVMHEEVTYNKYYEKFDEFRGATMKFLKTIGRKKKLLQSRITENFNIINAPMFAS